MRRLLEILPNELLLYFFEFFDTIHLLRSFFALNSRFNHLLYIHLQTHHFNFHSISKDSFDIICQQHLPSLIDRIISIRLSNDETPDLYNHLFSRGFTLDRFIRLRSLSLHYIHSLNTLNIIARQCTYLLHLTHFIVIKCNIEEKQKSVLMLFKSIWSIPRLTYCNLNGIELKQISLPNISLVSSSIEDLLIENISCDLSGLLHLLQCTPRVQRLSTTVYSHSDDEKLQCVISSMKSLKLFFHGPVESMKSIICNMPNLYRLTVETFDVYVDGHTWKQMLTESTCAIQVFELKMNLELPGNNDHDLEQSIDRLLDTFRTSYWIVEHRWYVRCDWEPSEITTYAFLYTLPYAFKTIYCLRECHTKSTCLDKNNYRSYNRVQYFENNHRKSFVLHNFDLVCSQFPNLRCLDIILPSEDGFEAHNVMLNQLTSLTVRIQIASAYAQLQTLCDRAPRLYSLRIIFWRKFTSKLFQLTSQSIRRLELGGMFNWSNEFTKEDCLAFCTSQLGHQCEVLSIEIEDRASIVDLIEGMFNLRLLNLRCRDDRWDQRKIPSTENELVHWIQHRFPWTYTIMRNPEKLSCIEVWIDQQEKRRKRDAVLAKSGLRVSLLLSSVQKLFTKK